MWHNFIKHIYKKYVTTKPRKLISTLIYHMKAIDTVATCDTGFFM